MIQYNTTLQNIQPHLKLKLISQGIYQMPNWFYVSFVNLSVHFIIEPQLYLLWKLGNAILSIKCDFHVLILNFLLEYDHFYHLAKADVELICIYIYAYILYIYIYIYIYIWIVLDILIDSLINVDM